MKKAFAAILLCAVAPAAFAATTVYTDVGTFTGAINPDYYLEDFNSFFEGQVTDFSYPFGPGGAGGYSYITSAPNGLYSGTGVWSTNTAFDPLIVDFTGPDVFAVGGNFWVTDIFFSTIPGSISLTLSDGTVETIPTSSPSNFRGFVSDIPITQLTITPSTTGANGWATLDNFYVGVPEPTTLSLLALGGLALIRRR